MAKQKRTRPNKFTLETPIVKAYIGFLATPKKIRAEGIKTIAEFMAANGLKSYGSLANYAKIDGFNDRVYEEQRKYKGYYLTRANKALLKRAEGCHTRTVSETTDQRGNTYRTQTLVEHPPEAKAAEIIYKAFGEMQDKTEVTLKGATFLDACKEVLKNKDSDK